MKVSVVKRKEIPEKYEHARRPRVSKHQSIYQRTAGLRRSQALAIGFETREQAASFSHTAAHKQGLSLACQIRGTTVYLTRRDA